MSRRDVARGLLRDARLVASCLAFAVVARLTAGRREENLWVFGARGGDGFVDNAKYLYLHVAHERPGVTPVWLSADRATVRELRTAGYRAHHTYSPAGIAASLRAGVVVVTQGLGDVNLPCAGGATVVNLWHGIPLKTVSWDAEFPDRSPVFRLAQRYLDRQVDLLAVPGEATVEAFRTGLGVALDRMATTGYPRIDALFERVPGEAVGLAEEAHRSVEALAADHSLVVYLPTYRDEGEPVADHLDVERLAPTLEAHDAYLFVKTHPFEPFEIPGGSDRVRQLPADTDVYPFLRLADVLVTDYSSVYFDFLVADDPVVFYPYDLDDYRASRGFYFDYESVTPGPVATDLDELRAALDAVLDGDDEFAAKRRAVRERFLADPEPGRAAAVYRAIRERSASSQAPESSKIVVPSHVERQRSE